MKNKNYFFDILCFFLTGACILFVIYPVIAMVLSVKWKIFAEEFYNKEIWKSLVSTVGATAISSLLGLVTGVPLAYVLTTAKPKIRNILEPLIEIPILLPPLIAGISLVHVFSENTFFHSIFSWFRISLNGSLWGIVLGMYFVGLPFIVRSTLTAFLSVPQGYVDSAKMMGACDSQIFFSILLPLSKKQILTGFLLMFGRSMGIFGTVVMISYYPRTIPVLIYETYISKGIEYAKIPAVFLIFFSTLFFFIRKIPGEKSK